MRTNRLDQFVLAHVGTALDPDLLGLIGLGSLPFGYIALWVIADQYPSFSLVPFLFFGIAMWAAALIYGAIAVIAKLRQKKDIAPSK